ncbi:MAG: Bug family tripartite tricarboxylate transporter substrate binding protein [Burkholderiales bacterium]
MLHVIALCLGLVSTAAAVPALAQSFPSRPLELVVHTSPGGGTDTLARTIADIITREKLVNQPINVSNKPGGGGAIAYTYIKGKRGDPHVVMAVATMAMLSQTVRPDLNLGLENYTPIAFLAQDPQALMVSASSPYKTFKDFVEAARKAPDGLVASITSPGGTGRMLVWMLEREIGAKFRTVSFKSGSDAIMQVLGGHTQFSTENISEGYGLVESKKMRVLAVTSKTRLAIVPDAPTLIELGHNIHIGTGRGFAMPADVPAEAASQMESILQRVYKSTLWKDFSEKNMFENIWMGRAEYAKHLAERRALVHEFLQAIGIAKK